MTFPAEPAEGVDSVPLANGTRVDIEEVTAYASMSNYSSTAVEYPDDIPISDDPDQALDDAVTGAVVNEEGATLAKADEVESNGKPGQRFKIEVQQGNALAEGQGVFFLDGQKLFHAIVVGPEQDADAHSAFVDSFELG